MLYLKFSADYMDYSLVNLSESDNDFLDKNTLSCLKEWNQDYQQIIQQSMEDRESNAKLIEDLDRRARELSQMILVSSEDQHIKLTYYSEGKLKPLFEAYKKGKEISFTEL